MGRSGHDLIAIHCMWLPDPEHASMLRCVHPLAVGGNGQEGVGAKVGPARLLHAITAPSCAHKLFPPVPGHSQPSYSPYPSCCVEHLFHP